MPVIEEIVDEEIDIDNMDYDPSDFDANNPFDRNMPVEGVQLRAAPQAQAQTQTQARAPPSSQPAAQPRAPSFEDPQMETLREALQENPRGRDIPEHMKEWKVIYPIYLDKARSVGEGRRVNASIAVKNPLSTRIVEAAQALGHEAALELTKTHPRDWANPGRVRISSQQPKRKLYADICAYLNKNLTTEKNCSKELFQQLAPFDSVHPLAVPRGMKINDILPGVSPALSAQKSIAESMNMENMGKMFGMG